MSTPKKWYMYSAHDTTVALLLSALNLSTTDCLYQIFTNPKYNQYCINAYPGFASNIIFELRQLETTYYVYIRYNGTYQPIPACGNEWRCEYNQFVSLINHQLVDYNKICGVPDNTPIVYVYKYENPPYSWALLTIFIIFAVSLIAWYIYLKATD